LADAVPSAARRSYAGDAPSSAVHTVALKKDQFVGDKDFGDD
jgi:hypothetical protein